MTACIGDLENWERGLPSCVDTGLLPVFSGHDHMPVILDCIISPARKQPCNHGPFVPIH